MLISKYSISGLLMGIVAVRSAQDTWDEYVAGGMNVISRTGSGATERTVILLHGGGGNANEWRYYDAWYGDTTGLKYVFPDTPLDDGLWYVPNKIAGCGLPDACAYDQESIETAAAAVAALIDYEMGLLGDVDGSKIYLGGFSMGGQMSGYVQLAELDFALGGTIVLSGFPLPPLSGMLGQEPADAKAAASYYETDMNWFIWHGGRDSIFPVTETIEYWDGAFEALEITSTLAVKTVIETQGHSVTAAEFAAMVDFVREGLPTLPPTPCEPCTNGQTNDPCAYASDCCSDECKIRGKKLIGVCGAYTESCGVPVSSPVTSPVTSPVSPPEFCGKNRDPCSGNEDCCSNNCNSKGRCKGNG